MKPIFSRYSPVFLLLACALLMPSVSDMALADCVAPPLGLVGWWRAENSAADFVATNSSSLVNGSFTNGVVGQAFSFYPNNYAYGTYTGVQIADRPEYALTNSLTIEGWIRPRSDSYVIFFRGDGRPGMDSYSLSMNGNHEFWFSIGDASGNGTNIITMIPYNQWIHVAATLNGTNGQMRVYTNGVLAGSKFTTIRPIGQLDAGQSPGVGIGNVNDGFNNFPFDGDVDEISLYNRALSQTEIQAIVNAGSAGKCTWVVSVSNTPALPVIANFTPTSGTNGSLVTILGTNFSAIAASNTVYFGAVKANVLGASTNVLTVQVSTGATFAPITVTVGGLTGYAGAPYLPVFPSGGALGVTSLSGPTNLTAGNGPARVAAGDLDGDGKADLVAANVYDGSIWIYRNTTATNGPTFAAPIMFTIGGGADNLYGLAIADLDGDGRLDIVAAHRTLNLCCILQNTSSPGSLTTNSFARVDLSVPGAPSGMAVQDLNGDGRPEIVTINYNSNAVSVLKNLTAGGMLTTNSFAAPLNFATGTGAFAVAIADLDGDGRADLVTANNLSSSTVSVLQNTSSGENISFAPKVDFPGLGTSSTVVVGDLDGDGKLDVAIGSQSAGQAVSIYRNTSSPGNFTTNSLAASVDFPTGGWANTVTLGDLDGDGKLDLAALVQLPSQLSIFKNISTPGSFTIGSFGARLDFASGWNPNGVAVADLTGDGRPEVVFGNTYDSNLSVYKNLVPFSTNVVTNPPPAVCSSAPAGIVGWWQGEGSTGDVTATNNGTFSASGASYAAGKVGQGFRFDGTNGYVQIPDSSSLKPTTVTLEAWIWLDPNLPANRGGEQIIFKKNTWSAWFEGYSMLKATVDNGNGTYSERFEFTVSRTGNQVSIRSQTLVQRGVWYHVAATYDGNVSTLFVNGVAEATATPGFALDYDTTPIFIGTSGTWAPYLSMFGGIIDEPTIYSRALNTNEIAAIYAAGTAGKCSPSITTPNTNSNLLVNGSFENPSGIYPYQVFSTGTSMPGWVIESGTVEINSSNYWQSAEGMQSLDLNGIFEDIGTIYQDIPTVPGQNYKVRFAYAGNPECGLPTLKTANAYWNGNLLTNLSFDITGHSTTNMGWIYYEQTVAATSTNSRIRFQATSPTFCGMTLDDVSVTPTSAPVITTLVDSSSPGFYNQSIGNVLDGTTEQFPLPLGAGTDSTIYPATEPSLAPASAILGDWLTPNSVLNGNWVYTTNIPTTWALTTETAIIYEVNGGQFGFSNLLCDLDVDNGVYVWVNGQFKFGARAPGLPSPVGQFEYTNINLGSLHAGTNRIQVIREDSAISTGYQIRLRGTPLTELPPADCTPPPVGLVGWWQGENASTDFINNNHGSLQGTVGYNSGKVGQAFTFSGTNQGIRVPASSILDVGAGNGFTVEVWIKPADISIGHALFEWNNSNYWGVHFAIESGQPFNANPGPGELYANIPDSGGFWHQFNSAGGVVTTNEFQHVALTYDKTSGVATIFRNGIVVAQQNLGSFTPLTGPGYDLYLGRRVVPAGEQASFVGTFDEPSLYNRALTTNEIIAIYNAGSAGKCFEVMLPAPVTLMNVDFGAGTNNYKVGFAAAGLTTNDFWNFYTRDDGFGSWRSSGSLTNLKNADSSVTAVGLTVNNAPGFWSSTSSDYMYAGYIYPFDSGNVLIAITNLPAGIYDVMPYSPNGNFTLTVGSSNYPAHTCIDLAASNAPVWQEGVQYVRFKNVPVAAGQPLVITVYPGVGDSALISGLQIGLSSLTNALPLPPVAPTITQQPTNTAAAINGLAAFNVTAQGSVPITYQWRFNGTNIIGATNSTLMLSNVSLALAGNYSVLVSNPGGSVISSNAALSVLSPPVIISQTPSQVVLLGHPATFVVNAGGTAPLSYYWFRNNSLIPDATNFSYTIPSAQFSDSNKKFTCVVSNAFGTATSTNATLKVIDTVANDLCSGAILITNTSYTNVQSTSQASSWGDPAPACVDGFGNGVWYQFTAPASGMLTVDTFGSDFDTGIGVYVGDCDAYTEVACNDDDGSPAARINLLPVSAGTTYRFLVGGYGAHVGNLVFRLNHFTPPAFDTQPTNISVVVSSNGQFNAAVSGTQPISLQWYFNNAPLADGGRISGVTNATLNIANVLTNDGGNYFVVASNFVGVTTSSVAVLTPVILPPSIIVQPSPASVFAGSNVTFTAVVDGTPPYFYQWYFGSTPLVDDGHFNGANTPSLTISNVTFADNGLYALVVTNDSGSDTSLAAALTVLVLPSITQQPIGRSVPPGLPTTFNALGSGNPAPRYQWQFNGTNIPSATSVSYTIAAVTTNELGLYAFVASNVVGVVTSSVAQLTFGPVAAWGRNLNNECLPPPNLSNVVDVAGCAAASFALKTDGTVIAWGSGSATNIPVSATNVAAIFGSGGTAMAALRADGTVVGWNTTGMPVLSNIVTLAISNNSGTAVRADGTLVSWAVPFSPFNAYVGYPTNLNRIRAVSVGYPHGLALRDDGTVVAWESNSRFNAPETNVPPGLNSVKAIAAGNFFSLALRSNGTVVAWGSGVFTNVPTSATNIVSISVDSSSILCAALRADGRVITWGTGSNGETNPPLALNGLQSVRAVATRLHSLALINDGPPQIVQPPIGLTSYLGRDVTLRGVVFGAAPLNYQWLLNGTNIVGATNATLSLPNIQFASAGGYQLFVSNHLGTAISLAAQVTVISNSTLMILSQNTATPTNLYQGGRFSIGGTTIQGNGPLRYQWFFSRTNNGYVALTGATNDTLIKDPALEMDTGNYYVAVSNLANGLTSSPVNVRVQFAKSWGYFPSTNVPVVTNAVAIVTGGNSGNSLGQYYALGVDGRVTAWTNNPNPSSPVNIGMTTLTTLSNSIVTAVAASYLHALGLKTDGTVVLLTTGGTNVPANLGGVTAIACGGSHDLALKADGTVVGWMNSVQNNYGQATNTAAATNIVAIAAGLYHSLGLRADGTVIGWGNSDGSTQIPSTTVNSTIAIAAGNNFSVALRTNGTVVQWGSGMISYPVPANVSNIVAISASGTHVSALRNNGTVVSWGYEYVGFAASNLPPDLTNVVGLASGGDHDIALFGTRAPAFTVNPWNRAVVISPGKGTNITLAGKVAGVQPMSYQWRLNGTNFPGATNDTLTLTYNFPVGGSTIPPGTYQLVASNSYGVAVSKPAKVTLIIPLGDAVEATNLNWLTSGSTLWFGQTNITHDGVDAARSGGIGGSQETILQTTIATNVAGAVSFWWKVSSEEFFDTLEFRVNGTVQASISGEVDWTQSIIPIAAGTNVLMWRYSKDSSFDSGLDSGFVDQFSFAIPPIITLQPAGAVANLGQNVALTVRVSGSPQLGFQWWKNGSPVGGNTSNLVLTSVARAASGTYCVTVTNAVGQVVSSNALVVVKVPQLLGTPVLLPDGSLSFTSMDANGGTLTEADLANFEAQASTNLVNWTTLADGLSLTNGMLRLNDAARTNFNSRYYRLVEH